MDLNWCPVCEQHIPLAWESSLYCSDRCKKADAMASHTGLGYAYPADLQTFPRTQRNNSVCYSPMSSPTLAGARSGSLSSSPSASGSMYPSPPTSPMSNNYLYNKTSASGRISPPLFSLGAPSTTTGTTMTSTLEFRRKSTTGPQYTSAATSLNGAKKGFFW